MSRLDEFRVSVRSLLMVMVAADTYDAVERAGVEFENLLNDFRPENALEQHVKMQAVEASSSIVAVNFAGDEAFIQHIQGVVEKRKADNPLYELETMLGEAITGRSGQRVDLRQTLPPETYRALMKEATDARRKSLN